MAIQKGDYHAKSNNIVGHAVVSEILYQQNKNIGDKILSFGIISFVIKVLEVFLLFASKESYFIFN